MGYSRKGSELYKTRGEGPPNATCAWCFYRQGSEGKTCGLERGGALMVTSADRACISFTPFEGWAEWVSSGMATRSNSTAMRRIRVRDLDANRKRKQSPSEDALKITPPSTPSDPSKVTTSATVADSARPSESSTPLGSKPLTGALTPCSPSPPPRPSNPGCGYASKLMALPSEHPESPPWTQ